MTRPSPRARSARASATAVYWYISLVDEYAPAGSSAADVLERCARGMDPGVAAIARAADLADEGTEPAGDLNATADYKRHLARVLTKRALEAAAGS